MPRARRTRFAAPFVISVAAAGCGQGKGPDPAPKPSTRPTWHVQHNVGGNGCSALQRIECPPPEVATCNPPAPMYMVCPPSAPATFTVIQLESGACIIEGQPGDVPCPTYDWPAPAGPSSR